jgi:hypothetical protein
MSNFYVRGVLANLTTFAILLACLFIPAGTLNYWQAWLLFPSQQREGRHPQSLLGDNNGSGLRQMRHLASGNGILASC